VKTAISIPDDTFDEASRRAHQLGMSRSAFFMVAARRYLDELDRSSLTEQINQALARVTGTDETAEAAVAAGRLALASEDDW
jgi:metal-responsive CopG/Arc/MetJ family transcriptional regulator